MYKYLNKINYLIAFYLMLLNNLYATNIKTVDDLIDLEQMIKKIKKDTLVIFDVDHVLIMYPDHYTYTRHPDRRKLWRELTAKSSIQEIKLLQSIIMLDSKSCLVDPKILDILEELKNKSIPVVALTFYPTGKLGIIKDLTEFRIKELQNVGIDFTNLSPFNKEKILINELKNENGIPTVEKGIIFTAELDKSVVLEKLLDKQKYFPKQIIFIDDKLEHLVAVNKLCNKLNIKFYGLHYIQVAQRPLANIDLKKERKRFNILIKQHKWLSLANPILNI